MLLIGRLSRKSVNAFDPERLNMYLYYDFSDKIQFKSEIEFEHGGTGATMEFESIGGVWRV